MGSKMTALMFVWPMWAMVKQLFPDELRRNVRNYVNKVVNYIYPYVVITFNEYQGDGTFVRSKAFIAIERYLSTNSIKKAKRLKANERHDCKSVILSMDDYEEVMDEFQGIKFWWTSSKRIPKQQSLFSNNGSEEKRYYKLTCSRKHRDFVTEFYLQHVLHEGKATALKTRQRKLYTNKNIQNGYGYQSKMWSHIAFEHPSTFDTLAMDPEKKNDILNDLMRFSKSKDFYKRVGKSWKRGYLLYGPPGTGKSSMIAAMANLLEYDIYDLELTSVKDNSELRRLLIDTSSKSIIVIEDIDCSLDLTGQRKKKKEKKKDGEKDIIRKIAEEDKVKEKNGSEVTLSGLLNFIDGLWSACGNERLIVFTTNYVEKLDPALIRRGRMDKHIELSYCCFEAFKVLSKNYLSIESHELFATVSRLLEETNMTPADVAENLIPGSAEENADVCLNKLIKALEDAKEEARLEVAEDSRNKAEKEAREASEAKEARLEANGGPKKADEEGDKKQLLSDEKENSVIVS